MYFAMGLGTILPIHRHRGSTVVRQAHQPIVVVLRGKIRQNFYEENGQLTESFEVSAGSGSTGSPQVIGFSVELGRWHKTECLESGTAILECKDGKSFDLLRNNEALGRKIFLRNAWKFTTQQEIATGVYV